MIEPSELFSGEGAPANRTNAHLAVRLQRVRYWTRRYWWITALTIMAALGIVDFINLRHVTRYVSTARMMISGRLSLPQGQAYTEGEELANFYGTQVTIMKSPEIVDQAADRVSTTHPDVTPDNQVDVDAGVEPRTFIFNLKVTSTNPDYARLLLDAIMDMYLSSKREWKNQTTDEAVSAITEAIARLDAEIRSDEQQLLDFQKTNNVVFVEEQSSSAATYLVGLNKELARLTRERDLLELESKDPLAGSLTTPVEPSPGKTADAGALPTAPDDRVAANSAEILAQQDAIEKLKILREHYSADLKDAHPKMIELADSISKEEKFLDVLKTRSQKTRDEHREDLDLQIKNLEQEIVTWSTKSLELSQRLATFQGLRGKVTRDQAIYDQLAASIQNVDLTKSMDQEDVVIMEAASKAKPLAPEFLLRLLYAVVAGLAIGTAIIYFVVRLDDKIGSPADIEENFDYPLLGEVPLARVDKKTGRVPLVSDDDDRFDFLEHHRNIRSALFFGETEATRARSILITSAAPGEGKSTLAANLAATCAFSGIRVLLIDADLRRGLQHTIFGFPAKPGLSNYLQGDVGWREVVRTTKIPNLDLLPRGKVSSRAGDLLLTAATDYLIQESAAEYDMILWDTPPLFAAHDAANLSSRIEGILFMARARHSSINLVRAAINDLLRRNARVLGLVLNAVEPGTTGYHNKYRYKSYSTAADL